MSLVFGAVSSDRVDHGSALQLTESFTVIQWQYCTSDTGAQNMWWQTAGATRHNLERKFQDTNDYSVLLRYNSVSASFDTTGVERPLNAWKFIAVTNLAADGGPRLYHGSLTANAVEASYSSRVGGSGTFETPSGNFLVGNSSALTEAFVGRIGVTLVWPATTLTLVQIIDQQWHPHVTAGCKLFVHYGFNGTSTQLDWSGTGNAGTVTGATVANHIPLIAPFGSDSVNLRVLQAAPFLPKSVLINQTINRASTY